MTNLRYFAAEGPDNDECWGNSFGVDMLDFGAHSHLHDNPGCDKQRAAYPQLPLLAPRTRCGVCGSPDPSHNRARCLSNAIS